MSSTMKVILLVEDNPDDLQLTLEAFKRARVLNPIAVVRDGIEALDFLFARGAYSERAGAPLPVVVLDLHLPKLDGLGVLKVIRTDARLQGLPVLILSSSKEQEDLISGHSLGISTFIRKPVDFAEFVAAIKTLGTYWLMIDESPLESLP